MAGSRQPESVRGVGFVLGRCPQMFILSVVWSDSSDSLIYRTFQEFRQFHKRLKDNFPLEAGLLKSSDCVLPKFQDTSVLLPSGRTRRGLARLRLLEAYAQKLLEATETVSGSQVVTSFFQPQTGDLEPVLPQNSLVIMPSPWERPEQRRSKKPLALEPDIHTLEAQTFRCLDSFSTQDTRGRPFKAGAGEELDVLLREPTGWWLVENEDKQIAWFPAPYLEEVSPREGCEMPQIHCSGMPFCTIRAYKSSREDELSVPAGARVTVLQVSERGWWHCRYRGHLGLLPAVLLRHCSEPVKGSGLSVLLNVSRDELELSGGAEAEPGPKRRPSTELLQLAPPSSTSESSYSGSGSEGGDNCGATGTPGSPPVVPARPRRGDILRSCCSVTRKALLRREAPGSSGAPLASGLERPQPAPRTANRLLAKPLPPLPHQPGPRKPCDAMF